MEQIKSNRVQIEVTIEVEGGGTIIYRYWDERKNWNETELNGHEFDDPAFIKDVSDHWANDGDVVIDQVEKIWKKVQNGDYRGSTKIVQSE